MGETGAGSSQGRHEAQGEGSWGGGQMKRGPPWAQGRYLRKASSGLGPRPGWAAGLSEKTSTRRLPAPEGAGGAAGGGAARSPRRSAEGEGVDCGQRGGR